MPNFMGLSSAHEGNPSSSQNKNMGGRAATAIAAAPRARPECLTALNTNTLTPVAHSPWPARGQARPR